MLRVVVYINTEPIIDTHAVRVKPNRPVPGEMCVYETSGGKRIRQAFEIGTGAAKLAIKLLRSYTK